MPHVNGEPHGLASHLYPNPRLSFAELHGEPHPHFPARPVTQLFVEQVKRDPRAIAIVSDTERLSYGELNARANQVARRLRSLGVGRESLVGICIDRSAEMAVGMIGILKSGAGYLPLDPEYPEERLNFMIGDARPALVLTKSELKQRFAGACPVVCFDADAKEIAANASQDLSDVPAPNDLAYIIYTSGSTGTPKGTMIEHRNLANYVLGLNHELGIRAADRYLHTASIAFSSSRRQLLLPLTQGACVVIASSDERKNPLALFRLIKREAVTVMDAVPSFWRNCTTILRGLPEIEREELLKNRLRLMLSASEPLLSNIPRTWMRDFNHPAHHVHMFGQTETAGIVSLFHVPHTISADTYVPVGRPIANTDFYVLNEDRELCAIDQAGEVYIGGAGVGRAYLNQPEVTAEKFVDWNGRRLCRTGDWARISADGRIEFAGRQDQQIKLRGFRVELGEIEAALAQHEAIRECAIVARAVGDARADKKIVAYFVPRNGAVTVKELRRFLADRLPDYCVPAAFVEMPALPLSVNGKIDRLRLPDPQTVPATVTDEFEPPRTELEVQVARIWSEVLGIAAVGRSDNFIELGGHSLLAAQITARIRNELNIELPIGMLFECATVGQLSQALTNAGSSLTRSISTRNRGTTAPLSFNQQQFWLLDQSSPKSAYHVASAMKIDGPLDVQRLEQAINAVVARHEVLRTNILIHDDAAVQMIAPEGSISLRFEDVSAMDVEVETTRAMAEESRTRFDLTAGPLLRARLLKLAPEQHLLIITLHHIICDGWSIGLLWREVTALYSPTGTLAPLAIQYADFASWQRESLQGETLEQQLNYWKKQLADLPSALELPADFSRPAQRSYEAGRISARLSGEVTRALQALARNENATLFMTLLAAFQTLLFRYSGQADVVVGSPVAGRTMLETENLIGAFVNTLVLRTDFAGEPTFRDLLSRARRVVLEAFSQQDLPFEILVAELNPQRSANRSPLFQVMFSYQNIPRADHAVNGVKFSRMNIESAAAKFDLGLNVQETPEGISLSLEFAKDLYLPATIKQMLDHFQNLLSAIISNPEQSVADVSMMSDAERQRLLVDCNSNKADTPPVACLHELLEMRAAEMPEAIAAEFRGDKLTYRQLNERANQLAHYLQSHGIGAEHLVGICVERSLEMLVAIFGVLKSGGGYVPLDPQYPRDRIAFMIGDADLAVVITQEHLMQAIPPQPKVVCLDRAWHTFARESRLNPASNVRSTNVAMVIYTSGSSGNPKGVVLEHRSLVHYVTSAADVYEFTKNDRVLQFASLSFDISAEEIHLTLSRGATLVLRTDEMISSAEDFFGYCRDHEISVVDLPTAYWHELTDALADNELQLPESLRLAIIGGEKASADRVARWHKRVGGRIRLVNSYGPTEITIVATACDLGPGSGGDAGGAPIGRPLPNYSVYVLDHRQRLSPTGVAGELYIGGPGLARGYLNRSQLTQEKFIINPVTGKERLYRTGDIVRYRTDGQLEFLGRADNQIKIRGFRVELEEIERTLRMLDEVTDCVVVARGEFDKRLIAYVVAQSGRPSVAEIRNFLKTKLAAYMLPATFEIIDALPRTPNGKIDRLALPEPVSDAQVDETFVPPSTPIAQLLATAWREVLRIDQISIHDNFFDLGGHSLLAARLVSAVRNELHIPFTMVDVFQAPTIATLSELLYPRIVATEPETELLQLLEEIALMTEEEARLKIETEIRLNEAAAA